MEKSSLEDEGKEHTISGCLYYLWAKNCPSGDQLKVDKQEVAVKNAEQAAEWVDDPWQYVLCTLVEAATVTGIHLLAKSMGRACIRQRGIQLSLNWLLRLFPGLILPLCQEICSLQLRVVDVVDVEPSRLPQLQGSTK